MLHSVRRTLALAALASLGATAAHAQSSTVHIDSGTSLSGFNGSSKTDQNGMTTQYVRLELTPTTPAASVTVTAQNYSYAGDWKFSLNDYFGATYSPGVTINPNYSDYAASSVTIPATQSVNFFQLPVDTFGSAYAFDLVESGPVAVGFDYKVFASDDLVEIADLRYTPGSSVPTLVFAAPGASITGATAAPEPSQFAALGLGVLGLGALALRARRRA